MYRDLVLNGLALGSQIYTYYAHRQLVTKEGPLRATKSSDNPNVSKYNFMITVCLCTHIHICLYKHTHTYTHACMHTCIDIYIYIHIYIHKHVPAKTCTA